MPHLGAAVHNVQPLTGGFFKNWNGLVAIVLALSGVEAIANATGIMKLDPGSSNEQPSVMKTAKPALLWIALEVCFLTAFLGLGMHALGGLHTVPGDSTGLDVDAPGSHGVRDYMLKYMGQVFVGGVFGRGRDRFSAYAVALVFALLLLSAVNTAIGGLITVQFLMARDGEMPPVFKKLNSYGVPQFGTIVATLIPAALVLLVSDVSGLADLYAVGVVGAIACNLGATSTDKKVPLHGANAAMMFGTFLLMAAIEISLFIDKPNARIFAAVILVVGLIMRELAKERAARKKARDEALAAKVAAADERHRQPGGEHRAVALDGGPGHGRRADALRRARHGAHAGFRAQGSAANAPAAVSVVRARADDHHGRGPAAQSGSATTRRGRSLPTPRNAPRARRRCCRATR